MKNIKDAVLQKKLRIERCIQQIRDYYALPSPCHLIKTL
jgi:hypothetical protein